MKNEKLMREGSIGALLVRMSLPVILIMMVTVLYNLADVFFIGRTGDRFQLAAISLAGPVFSTISAFNTLIHITIPNIKGALALCALLRTIDSFRLFDKVNLLTGGGPANSTSTITQYLYNFGIKSLDFGYGSAGAIIMTILVLLLSSIYIKRAMG